MRERCDSGTGRYPRAAHLDDAAGGLPVCRRVLALAQFSGPQDGCLIARFSRVAFFADHPGALPASGRLAGCGIGREIPETSTAATACGCDRVGRCDVRRPSFDGGDIEIARAAIAPPRSASLGGNPRRTHRGTSGQRHREALFGAIKNIARQQRLERALEHDLAFAARELEFRAASPAPIPRNRDRAWARALPDSQAMAVRSTLVRMSPTSQVFRSTYCATADGIVARRVRHMLARSRRPRDSLQWRGAGRAKKDARAFVVHHRYIVEIALGCVAAEFAEGLARAQAYAAPSRAADRCGQAGRRAARAGRLRQQAAQRFLAAVKADSGDSPRTIRRRRRRKAPPSRCAAPAGPAGRSGSAELSPNGSSKMAGSAATESRSSPRHDLDDNGARR